MVKKTNKRGTKKRHCINRITGDPRVFGKFVWPTLHIFAEWYPKNPTKVEQIEAIRFIKSLPYMLPCNHCGEHLLHFIKDYSKQTSLKKIVSTKDNMINFFRRAHNNVSYHTKNQRSNWTYKEVRKKWRKHHVCLDNKKLWRGSTLKRKLKMPNNPKNKTKRSKRK